MTAVAGNIGAQYPMKTAHSERLVIEATIPIGAAGAVGTVVADDPQCSCALNGTGDYTFTFPTAPGGRMGDLNVASAAGTIKGYGTLTFDPTAGTWRFVLNNGAGVATQPANGDVIHISVVLDVRGT